MLKDNQNSKFIKKTGRDWSREIGIELLDYAGWYKPEEFNTLLISRDDFLNMAANSTLKIPENPTRKQVAQFRTILGMK